MRRDALAVLSDAGLLDGSAARRVLAAAKGSGVPAALIVHQLGLVDDELVARRLAEASGANLVSRQEIPETAVAVAGLSVEFLKRKHILPLGWRGDTLDVGLIDPFDDAALAAAAFAARCPVAPRVMGAGSWKTAFEQLYGVQVAEPVVEEQDTQHADSALVRDYTQHAPAVRLVDAILEDALKLGASDIHIEPQPDRVRIRFRLDGELVVAREEAASLAASVAARVKILSGLDVADRRTPQDGRTSIAVEGRPVDVRVSTMPSAFGETVALRLLRRDATLLNLDSLGFDQRIHSLLTDVLSLKQGLFLVTGPTGSGKTTTLYSLIEKMRSRPIKIVSIEDPVEYFFPNISQTQVNEAAGLTFSRALRAFLRQDPDVILVGEVRDPETARIAIQASLTGHLVLATLHTADAPSAVARLEDMGVERFLLSATLAGVVSQRLVRTRCVCVQGVNSAGQRECVRCRGSGQSGRRIIAEGFGVDEATRGAILHGQDMEVALRRSGYVRLLQLADALVAEGVIHPAEAAGLKFA